MAEHLVRLRELPCNKHGKSYSPHQPCREAWPYLGRTLPLWPDADARDARNASLLPRFRAGNRMPSLPN